MHRREHLPMLSVLGRNHSPGQADGKFMENHLQLGISLDTTTILGKPTIKGYLSTLYFLMGTPRDFYSHQEWWLKQPKWGLEPATSVELG